MVTLWAETALLPDGWADRVGVEIDGEYIAAVTPGVAPSGYRTGVLLPAPANAHSHGFQRAMAGLTERRGPNPTDTFWTWRQLMYRFLSRLDPDRIEAIAALVQMEMLEAGYACNVEFHYLHHGPDGVPYGRLAETSERIAAAAARTGIGLTLLPVHYQFGGCDRRPLTAGQVRFGNDIDRFMRLYEDAGTAVKALPGDARIGVAAHSLRAVAAEDLPRLRAVADGAPFHMHLAEQTAEVEEVRRAHGARPVEWVLENLGPGADCTFVHCTQMLPFETEGLARSGAVAGLCPITEANLGDGIFDGVRWADGGGGIAVGSDSNVRIALAEELRTLDYTQRLRDRSRAAMATVDRSTGRRLFDAVTLGGATAAGRNGGAIAPGRLADLVALDAGHVDLAGRSGDTLLDSYIFAGDDRMITDVYAAGRHMVQGGRHVGREAIVADYRAAVSALVADL